MAEPVHPRSLLNTFERGLISRLLRDYGGSCIVTKHSDRGDFKALGRPCNIRFYHEKGLYYAELITGDVEGTYELGGQADLVKGMEDFIEMLIPLFRGEQPTMPRVKRQTA